LTKTELGFKNLFNQISKSSNYFCNFKNCKLILLDIRVLGESNKGNLSLKKLGTQYINKYDENRSKRSNSNSNSYQNPGRKNSSSKKDFDYKNITPSKSNTGLRSGNNSQGTLDIPGQQRHKSLSNSGSLAVQIVQKRHFSHSFKLFEAKPSANYPLNKNPNLTAYEQALQQSLNPSNKKEKKIPSGTLN
jgi:hypothetical protein